MYVLGADGTPEFRALPRLWTTDVADALQVARARILRYLEQRHLITLDSDADSDVLTVSEELAKRDPALAQLAAEAVSGLAPAGPELRRKPLLVRGALERHPHQLALNGRPRATPCQPRQTKWWTSSATSRLRRALEPLGLLALGLLALEQL